MPRMVQKKPTIEDANILRRGTDNMSHEDMLCAIAEYKDKDSFSALFEYFAPRIKSFLMKGGSTPDQAEELAQETMLTVWRKASSFDRRQSNASTWIFTIARNKKIDALRKSRRHAFDIETPETIEDEAPLAADNLVRLQETRILASALKDLPEDQATLLRKSFFEDKSHAEIAQETNIPLGTIKSRIRLALAKLRQQEQVKKLW